MPSRIRLLVNAVVGGCAAWALVGLLLVVVPSTAAAQDGKPFLESLPAETFACVQVSNMKGLVGKIKASPVYALKDHPTLKDAMAQLEAGLDQGMGQAETELGFNPLDLLGSFEGEVIVAVGGLKSLAGKLGGALSMQQDPDIAPDNIPVVIAGDAGASADKVREYVEKVCAFAEKEGAIRKSYSSGSGKITVLRDPSTNAGTGTTEGTGTTGTGDTGNLKFYLGEAGSRFYFSTSRQFLESFMAGGGEASLGSSPLFLESRKSTSGGDVFAYINLKELSDSIESALSATFFAFYWQKLKGLVFGNSLNNMALSITLEEKGIRQSAFFHNSGADDGLLALIKGQSFSSTPPEWVPGDVQAYSCTAFNAGQLGTTISEIAKLGMALSTPGADFDAMVEAALGVKLMDLTKSFGGRMYYYGAPAQLQNPFAGTSYVFDLADEGPMTTVMKKFSGPGQAVQTSQHGGKDVYTLQLPMGEIAASISGGKMILAGGKSEVVKFLDSTGSDATGLAGSEEFQKLTASAVPGNVTLITYTAKEYMANYMQTIVSTLAMATPPEMQMMLPALTALGETMGAAIGYGVWTDSGLRVESMTLYR